MIGIIVSASVVAVVFIIMAAVIPTFKHDVIMMIRANTIRANATGDMSLKFRVTGDFEEGIVYKAEVYKGNTTDLLYGSATLDENIKPRETRELVVVGFTATGSVPSSETNGPYLVFQDLAWYTLKIYYRNLDGTAEGDHSLSWRYAKFKD